MTAAERRSLDDAIRAARGRRERLRDCMADLERAIAAPAPGREKAWREALVPVLDELAVAFDHHVAETEESGGLLEQIVTDAPRLAHAVDGLREHHREVAGDIADLRDGTASPGEGVADPAALRTAVLELLGGLARHRQLGADLVYEAYQVDLGAGD